VVRRFSYVTAEQAGKTIASTISLYPVDSEAISINDAFNRVLAEDIRSPFDIPSWDTSHFDGYAIQAGDTADASVQTPVYLTVVDRLYPGQTPTREIHSGEACYITTGSFLPTGADSIIAVEATKPVNGDQIEVRSKVAFHNHVIRRGSDVEHGQTLFKKGHKLRAQDLTMCAALRIGNLTVFKKPAVAFICVGDELTDDLDAETAGTVINSLRYAVSALIRASGGEPLYLGIASDDIDAIKKKIDEGISRAELVLVTGGSSRGAKDVTAQAIDALGKPGVIVHGLKRKPGRVSGFAVVHGKPVALLPGLCHSLVVGFYTLVLPLIQTLSGRSEADSRWVVKATITGQIAFSRFLPFEQVTFVHVTKTPSGYHAAPFVGDSSSFSVLAHANAFIITPSRQVTVKAGSDVEAHLLPGFFTLNDLFSPSARRTCESIGSHE
jgi:molybdenum cofactor synthesis domain-containing protein